MAHDQTLSRSLCADNDTRPPAESRHEKKKNKEIMTSEERTPPSTVRQRSLEYGHSWCIRHGEELARAIFLWNSGTRTDAENLLVRVYDRTQNKIETVNVAKILEMIPTPPPEAFSNGAGQVTLGHNLYVSTSVYAMLRSLLLLIDMKKD